MLKQKEMQLGRLRNSGVGPGAVLLVAELPSSHKDTKLRRDKMPRLSMGNELKLETSES